MPLLTPPPDITPDIRVQTRDEYESAVNDHVNWLPKFWKELSPSYQELILIDANVKANASAMANLAWVSGISYTIGMVRYSPLDFLNYRRKTNGAGTTDPKNDAENWALITNTATGGGEITSGSADVVLTYNNYRFQSVAMTAPGKKVTLPSATTLNKGVATFVIANAGMYRFTVHRNGGTLLCVVEPGQTVLLSCADNITVAGVWGITGDNISKINSYSSATTVNSVDSRGTQILKLTSTKYIIFYKVGANTKISASTINIGGALGAAVDVVTEGAADFDVNVINSTQVLLSYVTATSTIIVKSLVITVTGDTPAPGAVLEVLNTGSISASPRCVRNSVISATKALCAYVTPSAAYVVGRMLTISGSTVTASATSVNLDALSVNASMGANFTLDFVSSSKIIHSYATNQQSTYFIRTQDVSGANPSPVGANCTVPIYGSEIVSGGTYAGHAVLSASRYLLVTSFNRGDRHLAFSLVDISSTTPAIIAVESLQIAAQFNNSEVSVVKLSSNKVFVQFEGIVGMDVMTVTITNDDDLILGKVQDNAMTLRQAVGQPGISCVAIDANNVLQVSRNAFGNIIFKQTEVAD